MKTDKKTIDSLRYYLTQSLKTINKLEETIDGLRYSLGQAEKTIDKLEKEFDTTKINEEEHIKKTEEQKKRLDHLQNWFEKWGHTYSGDFSEWRSVYNFFRRIEKIAEKDYSLKQFKIDLDTFCLANGYRIIEQRGRSTGNPLEIKLVKNE